ncbi:MAG: glycosyltransferase family 2 protein [Acidimicrobiia bacterium]
MKPLRLLDLAVATAAAPAAAFALHLAGLTAAGWSAGRNGRTPSRTPAPGTRPCFAVVVPAHDEEAGIAATVASLQTVRYPTERRRIIVVADNCSDGTAAAARAAGAVVLERRDAERRGKGYALELGFAAALADPGTDAVVVVDADTTVEPSILEAAAAAMADGALVMQADYRVRNPLRSWRTTLMEIAFTAMHTLRNEGRERLGLSVGLRGNGMVFTRAALQRCPYDSFGLVEDIEYAARLADAGIRVALLPGVTVRGDMPATAAGAASQRIRWEEGRRRLRRRTAAGLVRRAARRRQAMPLDVAAELAAPPLARLAITLAATAAVSVALGGRRRHGAASATVAGAGLVALSGHVAAAWARSGTGWSGAAALAKVPTYVLWKLRLRSSARQVDTWVRTARTEELPAA